MTTAFAGVSHEVEIVVTVLAIGALCVSAVSGWNAYRSPRWARRPAAVAALAIIGMWILGAIYDDTPPECDGPTWEVAVVVIAIFCAIVWVVSAFVRGWFEAARKRLRR